MVREACEAALREKHLLDSTDLEWFLDEADKKNSEELKALDAVFRKAAEDDTPNEVRKCVMQSCVVVLLMGEDLIFRCQIIFVVR